MRRLFYLLMILIAQATDASGQEPGVAKGLYFYGVAENSKDTLLLQVWDHVFYPLYHQMTLFRSDTAIVSGDGRFSLSDKEVQGPSYCTISKIRKGLAPEPILDLYLVEPGDSIYAIHFGKAHSRFIGQGSGKYNCRFELDRETTYGVAASCPWPDTARQFAILREYRPSMSQRAYAILHADLTGKQLHYDLYVRSGGFGHTQAGFKVSFRPGKTEFDTASLNESERRAFGSMIRELSAKEHADPAYAHESWRYVNYLLEKSLMQDRFLSPERAEVWKIKNSSHVLGDIMNTYSGDLRDRIATGFLTTRMLVQRNGPQLALETLDSVRDAPSRAELLRLLQSQQKGKPAFDFSLPDKNGRVFNLSDFKGKIVFLDFWYTGCGSCREFFQEALEPLESRYKDDPRIVFVTINADKKKEQWMKSLQGVPHRYTSDHAINLFGGSVYDNPVIYEKYFVNSMPRPFLIDGDGRIISASNMELRGDAAHVNKAIEEALDGLEK